MEQSLFFCSSLFPGNTVKRSPRLSCCWTRCLLRVSDQIVLEEICRSSLFSALGDPPRFLSVLFWRDKPRLFCYCTWVVLILALFLLPFSAQMPFCEDSSFLNSSHVDNFFFHTTFAQMTVNRLSRNVHCTTGTIFCTYSLLHFCLDSKLHFVALYMCKYHKVKSNLLPAFLDASWSSKEVEVTTENPAASVWFLL